LAARAKEVKQRGKIYENVIEQEETSQQLKEKFKPLWPKIKDKSSDEAVNMVFP
jgi:hypothetical protein